jgi:hypothetical protein
MAFGCNAMYNLLSNSVEKSADVMRAWLAACADAPMDQMTKMCQTVLQETIQFARGYLAVTSTSIADAVAHSAFTSTFMPQGKSSPEWIRLMVMCARKSTDFKILETSYVLSASKETKHGKEMMDFVTQLKEGSLEESDAEIIANRLPFFRECFRSGATTELEDLLKTWVRTRIGELMSEASAHTPDDKVRALQICQKLLGTLSKDEKSTAELLDIRTSVSDMIATYLYLFFLVTLFVSS